nr:hypothetical protein [Tanacetum cinerariifolium]
MVFANIRRVGKGFSGVETPLFEGMIIEQEIEEGRDAEEHVQDVTDTDVAQGDATAAYGEVPTVSQEPSIPSPTLPTPSPQPPQDLPSKSQRRIIDENKDDVVALMDDKEEEEAKVEMDEEYARKLHAELNKDIDWDVAIDHVKQKAKEDSAVQRYQVIKKKPQTEAQAQKNMIMYLKNVTGFKLAYLKVMSYDEIHPIFEAKFNSNTEFLLKTKEKMEEEESRALQNINETLAQKAAKRRKLNEEVEDLKRHLEIVPGEDDDVYTEATPLARKVPVVDYEIFNLNNKPYYKIIRADGTHQLYISFLTLLENFDREDLEALWSLVKERFSTSKPKNYSNDFLLTTLGAMFQKPDAHAQVWKNQRTRHGQAKVKSWKLLESYGQTTTGKEISNPFMAGSLPKTILTTFIHFWNTVAIKQDNDVTRLQALVDKKKVVVTEAAIREVLRLDDAEGVDCLPNEEIFAELARMGYEKPSLKLTFYKAFFSSQWKFLIHTILQSMSAKRTSWNEFSSAMVSVVICLSTGDDTTAHREVPTISKEPSITSPTPPPQPPQDLPSTSQVQHTPPQSPQAQLHTQPQPQTTNFPMSLLQEALDTYDALTRRVEHLEYDKVALSLEITKLKSRVKKLEKEKKVRVLKLQGLKKVRTSQRIDTSDDTVMDNESNQGRIIDELNKDDAIALIDDKEEDKKDEEDKEDEPAKVQEVVDVVTTAKLITKVVTAANEIIYVAEPQAHAATITAAPAKFVVAPTIDHVKLKAKEISAVQRYQAMKRKPQTEAQAQRNMMMYLKNVAGFKLDYFKRMSYNDIRPIFEAKFNSNVDFLLKTKEQMEDEESRALQTINETPA